MPPGVAWAAAFWILACLAGDSHQALTTFGKTNPNNQAAPAKPSPPPARECIREADCAGVQDTSCVKSPADFKMRCLCGDNRGPMNGKCDTKIKGLRHTCNFKTDCMEGMVCALPNVTKSTQNVKPPTQKVCLCDTQDGFVDRETYCSDAVVHKSLLTIVFMVAILTSWMKSNF